MKLWQRGTAALALLSMILVQTVAFAADRTVDLERNISRLAAFGIMSKSERVDQSPVTRGEMALLAVRATDNVPGEGKGTIYADVPAEHPYSGAIELANTLGIVGIPEDKMFNPDRQVSMSEALVMVTNAMGYADIALAAGGYPEGYKKVANDQNLTKGITNQLLTKEDAVRMISNMMDANSVRRLYYENNPSLTTSSYVTYLEDTFEVTKYKAEVQEVDTTSKTVTAKITDGVYTGEVYEYRLSPEVDINAVGGRVTLYVDNNEGDYVVYLELRSGNAGIITGSKAESGIIYDFISATNKNEYGTEMTIMDWKYVSFTNVDKTYRLGDDVIITYEDANVYTEARNYVGTFCKAVVQDGFVVRMDIYPLREGGIIYRADHDELRFSVGTKYENYWKGFSNAPDLQIFIDGKAGYKMQDLKSNMVFDYWYGGDTRFIIVASSRVAKGILTDVDDEFTTIGGAEYKISEPYGWYSFKTEKLGFVKGDFTDVYNMEVTAYLDDNQRVRYIMPEIGKEYKAPFKGFVIRAYGDDDLDNRFIKIYRADGGGTETYKVKRKLNKAGLTFEYAQSVQSNLDALGFLEFTLDENNEICKIENIEFFGNDTRVHTGMFDHGYNAIGGLYAGDADIYAVMEIDGVFTVKHVDYENQLAWAFPSAAGVKAVSDFDLRENPVADYIVLTKGSSEICDAGNMFDIVESVKWTGEDDIYRIKFLGGHVFDVDKAFVDAHNLKKNCLVRYGERNLGKFKIKIMDVKDFGGNCFDWRTDTYQTGVASGLYHATGVVTRTSNIIQFVADGVRTDVFMFYDDIVGGSSNMKIYEYLGKGKIIKARDAEGVGSQVPWYIRPFQKYPVMNIQDGDDIWFHLRNDGSGAPKIDYMIYKSNNIFFE